MKSVRVSGVYQGRELDKVGFPMGGMGTGMFCLEGTGTLGQMSLRHKPDLRSGSPLFAAICVKGAAGKNLARVVEGPVAPWKITGGGGSIFGGSGNGHIGGFHLGFPRFDKAEFSARFPFGTVRLCDGELPLTAQITGWSPFIPGDADASSLPVAGLEYAFTNPTRKPMEAVFSFHAQNFLRIAPEQGQKPADQVLKKTRGFVLLQEGIAGKPHAAGAFCVETDRAQACVDACWFRGGWYDAQTILWQTVEAGRTRNNAAVGSDAPSQGGSLYVPLVIGAGKTETVRVLCSWHVPFSDVHAGRGENEAEEACECRQGEGCFRPWYAARFDGIAAVAGYWRKKYDALRKQTQVFTDCYYDTTLPPEAIEAVAANLCILKSPTLMRQYDGRLWAWEGCFDLGGCCSGTCTHVWNYAQSLPHLFPALERTLRETEFKESQDACGHQNFRAALPIRPVDHKFYAAADGQLGGIIKMYRDWRISGDTGWLKRLWPEVRKSLEYCIEAWDPEHAGALTEPHHNTYDIEFWGADGMCTSFYLAALDAAVRMGEACGDGVALFAELLAKGKTYLHTRLWNGEYFVQNIQWKGLRAENPAEFSTGTAAAIKRDYSPEALELLRKEGPKYQYGTGCLSDGILGEWMAFVSGLAPVADAQKIRSHLKAVYRYNLKKDLRRHANPQRPGYALGAEGGLLLCTWPKGGLLGLPFVYSNEVWTGIEYQVASHLIACGCVKEGLDIVRVLRDRYDGYKRNPFNEYECGWWYARAMASYALLQALTGARYDALTQTLYLKPAQKGDFRAFFAAETGFGTVGVRGGKPFFAVKQGRLKIRKIELLA